MKEYKIGEIANIMNISKEMVRYYEKCGVITPHRIESNNYRCYSTIDLFWLMEASILFQFDVNVKDINDVKSGNFTMKMAKCYEKYLEKMNTEINYLSLKKERAGELLHRIERGRAKSQ